MSQHIHEQMADRISHTRRILTIVKESYNKLAQPYSSFKMGPERLFDLTDEYTSILAKHSPQDSDGITNLISYIAPRLPEELLHPDGNVIITFNNNPQFFIDDQGVKEGVRSAQSRSRWFKVETIPESEGSPTETRITMHAQSQTAVVETMVHLSFLEQLRKKVKSILTSGKKTEHDKTFLRGIDHLVQKGVLSDEESLELWANKTVEVEGSPSMGSWESLKGNSFTAQQIAEKAHTLLIGENQPTVLLFSNSYSLPNILSHYLLERSNVNGVSLRSYITDKAVNAWEHYKDVDINQLSTFKALGESIESIQKHLSEDQKNFIIDNLIIFYLTRKGEDLSRDPYIRDLITEFNAPERLKKCGVKTLIEKNQSATADSLHYIDFSQIDNEVLNGINPLFKTAIEQLKSKSLSAIFMPYAPGDLTYSIITEMQKQFKSLTAVAEVGKVAHSIHTERQRTIAGIGEMVVPTAVLSSYGSVKEDRLDNKVTLNDLHIFGPSGVKETIMMEAPSVILQDSDEMEAIIQKIYKDHHEKKNISINMETKNLKEGALANHISPLDIFEADYLSDHAFSRKILKAFREMGREDLFDQITKTLDRRGVFGVHAATAAVLNALARKVRMN